VWWHEWGPYVEQLQKQAEQGKTVPALANRPPLWPWLQAACDCYADLGGRLDWLRVHLWAIAHGESPVDLWLILRTAAEEVNEWQARRQTLVSRHSAPTSTSRSSGS